jgi:translation initiation factor IF-3
VGVITRDEALSLAREAGLDLVEIKADVRPPICKVMDYGKYKYEQSKKKSQKTTSKANEMKEIRLGRSVKIDKHDVAIRVAHARRFLIEGYKVMIVQRFRGREMAHPDIGFVRLKEVGAKLSDIAKVTRDPVMAGRQMTILVEPNKDKVAAYLKALARENKVQEELPELPPDDIDDDDDDDAEDIAADAADAAADAAAEAAAVAEAVAAASKPSAEKPSEPSAEKPSEPSAEKPSEPGASA